MLQQPAEPTRGAESEARPRPSAPLLASLLVGVLALDITPAAFVARLYEMTEVRPGTALEYLQAVQEVRRPILEDHGHKLVGLWEVMMNDYEVCTVWATDVDAHVRHGKAYDVARGLLSEDAAGVPGDPRIAEWHKLARQWTTKWREELMTPAPGTHCGPDDWGFDDSVLEEQAGK